jgi:hypothetical protein
MPEAGVNCSRHRRRAPAVRAHRRSVRASPRAAPCHGDRPPSRLHRDRGEFRLMTAGCRRVPPRPVRRTLEARDPLVPARYRTFGSSKVAELHLEGAPVSPLEQSTFDAAGMPSASSCATIVLRGACRCTRTAAESVALPADSRARCDAGGHRARSASRCARSSLGGAARETVGRGTPAPGASRPLVDAATATAGRTGRPHLGGSP